MKNNNRLILLGTVLVCVGFVCLIVVLSGFLTYGSAKPSDYTLNDETRTAAIDSATATANRARDLLSARVEQVITYYTNTGNQERLTLFSQLKDLLSAKDEIPDSINASIQALRSISGQEDEIQHMYNVQSLLNTIRDNEQIVKQETAALGTDIGQASAQRKAALAGWSTTVWILLLAFSVAIIAAGFTLNHSYQMKKVMAQIALYLLLVAGAVIMVFPFYWMISSALKTRLEVSLFPPRFTPSKWLNFENFRLAFNTAPFARYFINSVVVCFFSVLIVTVTTILASFAFSRLKFPGRELIFSALLSMMMLPFEMLVITNYSTIIRVGLNDTLGALIVPFISSIFYTYIMRNFFMSIPDSLYWSARVDGCSNWRYLWKVMVPIARPSLVTVILLNALASWNSFMWPLLVIKSTNNRTLPFGLYAFTTEGGTYQELIMAASTVTVLPMIILFLFARKQILRGVARGGLKG